MPMFGVAANHARCTGCGALTAITTGQDIGSMTCEEDGAQMVPVAVVSCPETVLSNCTDSAHQAETTQHVVEIDG